ncbi:MAG TPA: hypothetical protein ENJ08_10425 [Gammaproteobacteria bacterium]|nr:hypothetical protein [Gammaproteobacteria bacterium]
MWTVNIRERVQGPAIGDGLISWLDAQAAGRMFQLPVDIFMGSFGLDSSCLSAGNTKIEIALDTGAMSLDLSMHLKYHCSSYPCKVWLEGTWGALISQGTEKSIPVFSVHRVVGRANEQDVNIRLFKE